MFPSTRRARASSTLAALALLILGPAVGGPTPVGDPADPATEAVTADNAAPPPSSGPAPAASPDDAGPGPVRMADYLVEGRQDNLVGIAESASAGTIGSDELADRPLLRTGEVLETIPGVIITQHAGGGKANQYFTRGFNLDHGTDFSVDLDGMPLNLPSHAHGQGYADMNIIIPELIDHLDYEKGPYFPANGDFSTVGAAHIAYVDAVPADFLKFEAGTDGFLRAVAALTAPVGAGHLLVAAEVYHENGPWAVPDDYTRYNGIIKYSQGNAARGFSVTAMAYHGSWNSTDQVAASAVATGQIPFYGSQSPTDGGYSQRYSLQAEWHQQDGGSSTELMGYAFHYDLNLFSNFTYFLVSPDGDQFEQQDNRNVIGFRGRHAVEGEFLGHRMENVFGAQLQNSWIAVGLYQTEDRARTAKVDYEGNVIPATTKADSILESSAGLYYENRIWWAEKFRTEVGLREDVYNVDVKDLEPANSGDRTAALTSPKLGLVFGPWDQTEFYAQAGYGYHSNDARTDTATVNPDESLVGTRLPVLVPARGGEVGIRTAVVPTLRSTLSLWYLHNDSELYFNGIDADNGETSPSEQATNRYGVEWANYYTPSRWVTFDLDYADSWAHFVTPTTAAEDVTPGGTLVDEAIHESVSAGVTFLPAEGFEATLRWRYFGPRPLTSDGSVTSASTSIVNLGLGYRLDRHWRVTCSVLNLFNRHDHDIDYYYQSRNSAAPGAPAPFEDHFHPVEPIEVRFGVEARL